MICIKNKFHCLYIKIKKLFSVQRNLKKILFEPGVTKLDFWMRLIAYLPSRHILVPRTSRGRPPPTSPGRPLKILFDRPGDVLKLCAGDILIWHSRDVPGRLIRDVPRKFSGRPLEDLESTQTCMPKFFFLNLFDWPNLKAFQHSNF